MEQKILKKIVMTKPVKLRRINQYKWCPKCNDLVKINMVGPDGFCPHDGCWRKLYTIDNRFNASNFGSEDRR
jgi:hypothetical protein